MSETVGFIGLGVMGRPMAKHILAKGYGARRSQPQPRRRGRTGRGRGARLRTRPPTSRGAPTVIITMVPDTPDVEAVLLGRDGVLEGIAGGRGRDRHEQHLARGDPPVSRLRSRTKGGTMLDAPVSGGEIGAINATLSIMVGGDAAALARVRPILECMGNPERIVHVGAEPGSGQVCKICNQIAIGGALAGVSEAFAVARKAGVDAAKVREALLGGFAASRVLEVHGERMIKRNYVPGFRARLYQKDLRLASEAAGASGVAIPATAVVTQLLNALIASGGADLDYSALGTVCSTLPASRRAPRKIRAS